MNIVFQNICSNFEVGHLCLLYLKHNADARDVSVALSIVLWYCLSTKGQVEVDGQTTVRRRVGSALSPSSNDSRPQPVNAWTADDDHEFQTTAADDYRSPSPSSSASSMMSFSDGKTVTAMLPASTVGDNLKLFF